MHASTKTLKLSAKQRSLLAKGLTKPEGSGRSQLLGGNDGRKEPARSPEPSNTGGNANKKRKRDHADGGAEPSAKEMRPAGTGELPGRLRAAQFRFINEMLYTTTSKDAVAKTTENPELLVAYHEGFRHQVSQWPVNPVDLFVAELQSLLGKRGEGAGKEAGDKPKRLVVADLGCGEAKIAQTFQNDRRIQVHSFDLTAVNSFVTACDIASTPLDSKSVDLAIFCLSLMGTNYLDFVREAVRILRPSGHLRIAEVKSRISDTDQFVQAIESCGLRLQTKDSKNKMFEVFSFVKAKDASKGKLVDFALKPCMYKKR